MGHTAMQDKLFALYDGELTGAVRQEIETHLASCRACRQLYTRWQQTAQVFFRPPHVQVAEAFVHQLMERIAVVERPHRVRRWPVAVRWLVPAVGLAGLLLLFVRPGRGALSIETLLLGEGQGSEQTQLLLASEPPTTEQMFGVMMEGQP